MNSHWATPESSIVFSLEYSHHLIMWIIQGHETYNIVYPYQALLYSYKSNIADTGRFVCAVCRYGHFRSCIDITASSRGPNGHSLQRCHTGMPRSGHEKSHPVTLYRNRAHLALYCLLQMPTAKFLLKSAR